MSRDTAIRGGILVTDKERRRADILCHDGRIAAIGADIDIPAAATVIDAGGCFVMPGGIDPHTHLELPMAGTRVADDFLSGTRAAVAGGTTTILDFVGPARGEPPLDALAAWREKAARSVIDYGFHMTVSWWGDLFERQMTTLVRDEGVTSFKFFLAYKGGLMLPDADILAAFERCRDLGALAQMHAENGEIIAFLQEKLRTKGILEPRGHVLSRPPYAEEEASVRAIALAEAAGVPLYIVHVSTAGAADAIARAQSRKARVFGETLPGFLSIDDRVYGSPDFDMAAGHVMSPPFRPAEHQRALWRAIEDGVLSVTATDHCCFTREQKRLGREDFTLIPNGCGGVGDRMEILWELGVASGRLTPEQFVALTSANAARIFNLWPAKGCLAVGADADIAILDPARGRTIRAADQIQNTDFSIWEGRRVSASIVHTLSRGRHLWADGELRADPGHGRYVARRPYGPAYGVNPHTGL
ncbi:MAG: dihydropyrimidinase [Telmatospirillum sp.]|nr:dihydropyrimidinase [Telmatospirillum sp.]